MKRRLSFFLFFFFAIGWSPNMPQLHCAWRQRPSQNAPSPTSEVASVYSFISEANCQAEIRRSWSNWAFSFSALSEFFCSQRSHSSHSSQGYLRSQVLSVLCVLRVVLCCQGSLYYLFLGFSAFSHLRCSLALVLCPLSGHCALCVFSILFVVLFLCI